MLETKTQRRMLLTCFSFIKYKLHSGLDCLHNNKKTKAEPFHLKLALAPALPPHFHKNYRAHAQFHKKSGSKVHWIFPGLGICSSVF